MSREECEVRQHSMSAIVHEKKRTKECVCMCTIGLSLVILSHSSISLRLVSEMLERQTKAQRGKWSHAAEVELQNHDTAE